MRPGEKNGGSWICRLDVIQSLSKNVLSLGQHTFIKCFLCDRHCVTSCEHRGAQDTSFILGAYGEAHQKRQECRRWFQDNVLSAMTEAVTGMMAAERGLLSSAWGIGGGFSRSLEEWVGWRERRAPSTTWAKSAEVQNIPVHMWVRKGEVRGMGRKGLRRKSWMLLDRKRWMCAVRDSKMKYRQFYQGTYQLAKLTN